MHSTLFIVASLALLVVCACAPVEEEVIQHIRPKPEKTPSVTGNEDAESGASGKVAGVTEDKVRVRREVIGGQESDLLPADNEVDASPFGETSQLVGHGRIRVLPTFMG